MQLVVIFNPTTTRPYIQQHMSLQMLSNMEKKNLFNINWVYKMFCVQHSYFYPSRNFRYLFTWKGGGEKKCHNHEREYPNRKTK